MKDFGINIAPDDSSTDNKDNLCILIEISSDYYEAYLTIKAIDNNKSITKEDIIASLDNKNISYGIDYEEIDRVIYNPVLDKKILIAKGEKHENGVDGRIEYNVDFLNTPKPTLLEDGNVDHKNLNYIQRVRQGEIIANKVLPTSGSDGTTVTGRSIKAKPGKLVNFKAGKNTIISNDNMYLISKQGGLIKLVDEKVCVIPILEINSDIGIATGNIHFNGKIIIKGNVERGYIITSDDEVEVFGIVEGSEINAQGNILIHNGANNGAKLISKKNIIAKFMEGCMAEAEEDIICEAILHCDIEAKQNLVTQNGKGLIVGGDIKVRKEINAKIIGSQIGTLTKIILGIDPELLEDYKNTNELIKQVKENAKKLDQAISILEPQCKGHNKDTKFQLMLDKTYNTKRQHITQIESLQETQKQIVKLMDDLKHARLSADIIYPGVKIKVNNSHYNSRSILKNIILVKEEGEIRSLPKV